MAGEQVTGGQVTGEHVAGAPAADSWRSDPVRVIVTDWHSTLQDRRDGGFDRWGFLTAVDRGDRLEVVVLVEASARYRALLVQTEVPADHPELRSVSDLWLGASWHEREAREMFGLTFTGLRDDRPLLLRSPVDQPPMRRSALLAARSERPWPGAFDPGQGRGNASRRRLLPPGVPEPRA